MSGLACLLAGAWLPAPARADDSSAGVIFPGWRSEPAGRVTVSGGSVLLDAGQVSVGLTASVAGPAALAVAFPRFGFMGGQETYPDRHFPELAVFADGRAVPLESRFSAFSGSADVTGLVRESAIDPYIVANTPPLIPRNAASSLQMIPLERANAVAATQDGALAQWTVARTARFALTPGQRQVAYRYRGRPAIGLLTGPLPEAALQSVCLTDGALQQAIGHPIQSRPYAFRLYALPAGIDGRAPPAIGLRIAAPDPNEHNRILTAFCQRDGTPWLSQTAQSGLAARPDGDGVIHILSISDESLSP